MATITFKIKGKTLLMHNIQCANPLFPGTKLLKELTSVRSKTDEILMQISDQEFRNGIYHHPDLGPYVPGIWMFKCLESGAKTFKMGSKVKASCVVKETKIPLEYEGPRDLESLVKDDSFRLIQAVGVSQAMVMRTRPYFQDWSLKFSVIFNDEIINRKDLVQALTICGDLIGTGDYRPHYGRFDVEVVK